MNKQAQQKLLALVRKNYQEIAEEFHQTRQNQLWPEIKRIASQVPAGSRVLDVGCGNGRLGTALGQNIKYFGVDISPKLIEIAQKNIKNPNCQFIVGDLLELDKIDQLQNQLFDFIFCLAVLHHIPGSDLRLKALSQMANKLKPQGKIIISVWNLWARAEKRKLIFKFAWRKLRQQHSYGWGDIIFGWGKDKTSQRYYHAFCAWELRRLAAKASLKIEKLYKDKYNYYLILKK